MVVLTRQRRGRREEGGSPPQGRGVPRCVTTDTPSMGWPACREQRESRLRTRGRTRRRGGGTRPGRSWRGRRSERRRSRRAGGSWKPSGTGSRGRRRRRRSGGRPGMRRLLLMLAARRRRRLLLSRHKDRRGRMGMWSLLPRSMGQERWRRGQRANVTAWSLLLWRRRACRGRPTSGARAAVRRARPELRRSSRRTALRSGGRARAGARSLLLLRSRRRGRPRQRSRE
mmetsp:Transcript_47054/g.147588  ORF Transcript_47054/g.147588 Transcript_47054/m.147588 type:complete len:228 (-) Transcript_47054:1385-2068(-)